MLCRNFGGGLWPRRRGRGVHHGNAAAEQVSGVWGIGEEDGAGFGSGRPRAQAWPRAQARTGRTGPMHGVWGLGDQAVTRVVRARTLDDSARLGVAVGGDVDGAALAVGERVEKDPVEDWIDGGDP